MSLFISDPRWYSVRDTSFVCTGDGSLKRLLLSVQERPKELVKDNILFPNPGTVGKVELSNTREFNKRH